MERSIRFFLVWLALTATIFAQSLTKAGGSGTTKVGGSGTTKAESMVRTIYFGNCTTAGLPPAGWVTSFDGVRLYHGTPPTSPSTVQKVTEFTCPGSGPQTLNSMEFYCYQRSAGGNIRMGIYTYASTSADAGTIYSYTLNLVAEHSAKTSVNSGSSGSPVWFGLAAGLTGTTTLIGGQRYIVGTALDSANVGYAYTNSTNNLTRITADYTGGMLTPLTGGSANITPSFVVRVSITGNGPQAAVPTQETYYVDTDYGGGSSTGSAAAPYINLQTAIAARCNKTFTLPIVFHCSGATRDNIRVDTSGLGQFVAASGKELRIYGDFLGTVKDATKYGIETAFVSGQGAGMGMELDKSYIWIEGIQVGQSSLAGQNATAEIVYWSQGSTGYMKNFIVYGCNDASAVNTTLGFSSINGINLINGAIFDLGAGIGTGVKNHQASNFYSLTVRGPALGHGLDITDGASVGKNLYLSGGVASITYGTGTLAQTTVATSDALSDDAALDNIAWSTANFTNVTATTVDISLPGGSALLAVGTDTSGEASPFNFTTDITGATRTVPWSIGAAE